jgi:hypothetical protein
MPLFSVIVVYYQGTQPPDVFQRGIDSLRAQTFIDYEILCYHDGPLLDPAIDSPVPILATPQRYNDSGHSLRDLGIRRASGDYILHFNVDNVLYPNALEEIAKEIRRPPRLCNDAGVPIDTNEIVVFPVRMYGLHRMIGRAVIQLRDTSFYEIFTGNPPVLQNIDCMQLVMRRDLWLKEGGWHDKRAMSDGYLYEAFCRKYAYRTVGPVLGEHY